MAEPLFNAQEIAVYGQQENAKRYQDLKNRAEKSASRYDFNPFDASTYGNFGNWLANGVSGGGWTHKSRMENAGFTDDVDALGKEGQFGGYALGQLDNALSTSIRNRTNQLEAGKGLFSGIPIVGDILSAPAQVVSAGKDLAESGTSKWENGKRDWLSDVGALGETALDVATLGAGSGATAGAKSLGKSIGKGAMLGAGYGLTGGLNEMGAKNFDLGRLATGTAIGAGVGGGLAGLGRAWKKYAPTTRTETITTAGDTTPYQEALNTLKNNATGARYSDVVTNLPTTQGLDLARINLNNLDEKTLKDMFRSGVKNVSNKGANEMTTTLTNSKNLLQDFLKNGVPSSTTTTTVPLSKMERVKAFGSNIPNMGRDLKNTKAGTKVSNLLKTKKGKVLAGAGGGLLLAQLLRNNNSNPDEMSEEELNELYNYVYGGQ